MGIQFLNGFGSMQSYYNRAAEIPTVSPEEISRQMQQPTAQSVEEEKTQQDYSSQASPVSDLRSRTADLENISLTFNKEDDFEYIGSDSGLENLDIQKAISDMRRDEVLQEYQYFVGSSQALFQGEDGLVIPKFAE